MHSIASTKDFDGRYFTMPDIQSCPAFHLKPKLGPVRPHRPWRFRNFAGECEASPDTLSGVIRALNPSAKQAMRSLVALLAVMLLSVSGALGGTAQEEAKKLFERYTDSERTFDPAVTDLYSDEAKIQNKRIYPDGSTRVTTMPAPKYKALIRAAMPLAKQRGDTNTWSEVKYVAEGERIRITAMRFSNLKKYSSPVSLLVGAAPEGKWLILEELSESRP